MSAFAARLAAVRRQPRRPPPPEDIVMMLVCALMGLAGQFLLVFTVGIISAWVTVIGDVVFIHALLTFLYGWYTAKNLDDPPEREMVKRIITSTIVGVTTIKVGIIATVVEVIVRISVGSW